MRIRTLFLCFIGILTLNNQSFCYGPPQGCASEKLTTICQAYHEFLVSEFPEYVTAFALGPTTSWTDLSPAAIALRTAKIDALAQAIQALPLADLNCDELICAQSLQQEIELWQKKCTDDGAYCYAAHPLIALIELPFIMSRMPHETMDDYGCIEQRLHAIPTLVTQIITLINRHTISLEIFSDQTIAAFQSTFNDFCEPTPTKNPLFFFYENLPQTISQEGKRALCARARELLINDIIPAFSQLQEVVTRAYCQYADRQNRSSIKSKWYEDQAKMYTNSTLSVQEIHDLGTAEVARIENEMIALILDNGFAGSIQEFIQQLRSQTHYFYPDPQSLIASLKKRIEIVEHHLPRLFLQKPKISCSVQIIPPNSPFAPLGAYYISGSVKNNVPGNFYVNAHNLPNFPDWELDALILHEALPGHHLQMSLAQEVQKMPIFFRTESQSFYNFTAFIEGWGLYAESLGKELGLYKDYASRFGKLSYEMMRAVRLVIDTGLHAFNWSREQAVDYFVEKTGMTVELARDEVKRYLLWPAQALSYKIGELKIHELRAYAHTILKDHFDIRQFHHQILAHGYIHLDVLEKHIKKWALDLSNAH